MARAKSPTRISSSMLQRGFRRSYREVLLGVRVGKPEVDADGMSTTPLFFKARIVQERDVDTRKLRTYIPDWTTLDKLKAKDKFSDRGLLDKCYAEATRRSRGQGASHWRNVTQYFVEEVTVMTQCLFLTYLTALTRGSAISEVVVDKACKGIAHELKYEMIRSLASKGLAQSALAESIDVTPMRARDMEQVRGIGSKFDVNLGVNVHMMAYGWVRDMGRGPSSAGRQTPYDAILEWIKYYNITPRNPLMTQAQLAVLIGATIDRHGYVGNDFALEALGAVAVRNIANYYIFQALGDLDKQVNKMIPAYDAMMSGWKKSVDVPDGFYTLTVSA